MNCVKISTVFSIIFCRADIGSTKAFLLTSSRVTYRTCCERSVVRLRAALVALTLRRPCLFVNALWRIFLMRFGRSPSGILAFVRRRRLFLIKSSYKRTKLVFVRLEIDRQGNLSVCVCFSKPNSASMRKSGMTLYGALNSVLFFA